MLRPEACTGMFPSHCSLDCGTDYFKGPRGEEMTGRSGSDSYPEENMKDIIVLELF